MTEDKSPIDHARAFLGVPFRWGGRFKEEGLDCVGLIWAVGQHLGFYQGLSLPFYSPYMEAQGVMNLLHTYLTLKSFLDFQEGDIGVFAYGRGPRHLGFLTKSSLIHASFPLGCVVEQKCLGQLTHLFCFKKDFKKSSLGI